MSTATRGTVLAGRYRLEERLQSNADGALWRAVDATLDRRVSIRVMRPAHPFAADVADAARRAALIDDARLVRVLDVGSDGNVGFVVSEDVDGDSLAVLVERSPLAPPVVRRIIGEVAQGLEAAAARGLHHLCLTPRSVIVLRNGSVKIVGTAVEAAAAGLEPAHAATANRDDALALVGLLYSGLTGRWPLGNAGFPPAPRGEGGGPVPPADLVRGIPNDLDTLCVVTLGSTDDGPRSPAELATELSPWPTSEEAPLRAAPRRQPTDPPPAPLGAGSPLKIRSRPLSKRGSGPKSGRSATPPPTPTPPIASSPTSEAADPGELTESSSGGAPRRSASMFPASVALTGSLPIPKEPTGDGPRRMDSLFSPTDPPAETTETTPPAATTPPAPIRPATAPPITRAPAGSAFLPTSPPPAGPAPSSPQGDTTPIRPPSEVPSRKPTASRSMFSASGTKPAPERAVPLIPPPPTMPTPVAQNPSTIRATPTELPSSPARPAEGSAPATGFGAGGGGRPANDPLLPWGPAWSQNPGPSSGADSTGPFPILIPAETPPREQSRLVIFSITVVLVLGLVVAAFSLRDLGSSGDEGVVPSDLATALPTAGVTTPSEVEPSELASTEPAEPTTKPTPTESVPVRIASIRAIDPQGDGDEDTARSPLAVDGNDSTSWKSQTYRSSSFGGLKKGVGLSLKLKQSAILTSATIDVSGTGGTVEVRTSSSADVSSSKVVGRAAIKNGRVTVDVKNAKAAKYVILWFTKLPSVGGNYKVEVSEVRLK